MKLSDPNSGGNIFLLYQHYKLYSFIRQFVEFQDHELDHLMLDKKHFCPIKLCSFLSVSIEHYQVFQQFYRQTHTIYGFSNIGYRSKDN